MLSAFQVNKNLRGIPVELSVSFLKKARGVVSCTATVDCTTLAAGKYSVFMKLVDAKGEVVSTCTVQWSLVASSKKGAEVEPTKPYPLHRSPTAGPAAEEDKAAKKAK